MCYTYIQKETETQYKSNENWNQVVTGKLAR